MTRKLTSALSLPVAYGGVDEVAARHPVMMALAARLAEPRARQEAQMRRVRLPLLEGSASLTEKQVKRKTITTSCRSQLMEQKQSLLLLLS